MPKPERLSLKRKTKNTSAMGPSIKRIAVNLPTEKEKLNTKRYFIDESKETNKQSCDTSLDLESVNKNAVENIEQMIVVRKPTIGSLPAFIPIG